MKLTFDKNYLLTIFNDDLSKDNVRNQIGLPFIEFIKTPFSPLTSDMFGNSDFMITYTESCQVDFIEIYNTVEFYFNGMQIYRNNFKEIKEIIDKLGINYLIDEYSIKIDVLGIEFYFPELPYDKELAMLESILIYKSFYNTQLSIHP